MKRKSSGLSERSDIWWNIQGKITLRFKFKSNTNSNFLGFSQFSTDPRKRSKGRDETQVQRAAASKTRCWTCWEEIARLRRFWKFRHEQLHISHHHHGYNRAREAQNVSCYSQVWALTVGHDTWKYISVQKLICPVLPVGQVVQAKHWSWVSRGKRWITLWTN